MHKYTHVVKVTFCIDNLYMETFVMETLRNIMTVFKRRRVYQRFKLMHFLYQGYLHLIFLSVQTCFQILKTRHNRMFLFKIYLNHISLKCFNI